MTSDQCTIRSNFVNPPLPAYMSEMARENTERWVEEATAEAGVADKLIAAAGDHFSKFGYEKTTLADLAKAIGFSKTYFYRFFRSKQEIGEAVCAQCFNKILTAVAEETAGLSSASEALRALLRTVPIKASQFQREERRLYDIAAVASVEEWGVYSSFRSEIECLVRQILQDGRDRAEFERKTPIDELTRAILLSVRSFIDPQLIQYNLQFIPDGTNEVISLVLRSLAP